MTIVLHELVNRDDHGFSPHCWRTRMALAHKELDHELRPVRFTEIGKIAGGKVRTLPAIEDDGQLVVDSWAIAEHLEESYPDRPSLFSGEGGQALSRFVQGWCIATVHPRLIGMIVFDVHQQLAAEDQAYFRSTRERRFGRPLEDIQGDREQDLEPFRKLLQPLRLLLSDQPFLGGRNPLYADYLVFGALQWARVVSPFQVLADGDPVAAWFENCLDLYDGLGRSVPAAG